MSYDLNRFVAAQKDSYAAALSEIRNGKKQTHWMWYIFPQLQGLGYSSTAKYYAIKDLQEATAYVKHPVLGTRLKEICSVLLLLKTSNAGQVFGSPDDMKLKSSMTLFSETESGSEVFEAVLKKFFNGVKDRSTLKLIGRQ